MFPLIETAIAFAAAMLAASLFVSALVQGLQNLGRYRSDVVERMLRSLFHGFRAFYNDPDVLEADYPKAGTAPEEVVKRRERLVATESEFVRDVLSDPALHARGDGIRYGADPQTLAKLVEYIDPADLVTIARNHAESPPPDANPNPEQAMDVTSPSVPPPSSSTIKGVAQRKSDEKQFLPAEWFVPRAKDTARAAFEAQKPYATVARFADYVQRWFPTLEATASENFKKRIRRLTLVVSCSVVVLFNLDGLRLAQALYHDSGARATFAERIPVLQEEAARLGLTTADVQPTADSKTDLKADAGALLAALDDPSLGLGWQNSAIVDKWCGATGKCPSQSSVSRAQLVTATLSWVLGLFLSCVLLSLGAPFWYNTLASLLNLRNAVQARKEDAPKAAASDTKPSLPPAAP